MTSVSAGPQPGLRLVDVGFRYGGMSILDQVSQNVSGGGTLVVRGANGVGKSTFLRVCAGLLFPQVGDVTLNGVPVAQAHPRDLAKANVRRAVVFEQGALVSRMTALDNVALPLQYHADALGIDPSDAKGLARKALERVGVKSSDIHALPGRLSFGIEKRVAFARAIAARPTFLFLDDPLLGLDRESAGIVLDVVEEFEVDPDVTLVVVSNSEAVLSRLQTPAHELLGARLVDMSALAPPGKLLTRSSIEGLARISGQEP